MMIWMKLDMCVFLQNNAPSAMGLGETEYKFINTAPCAVTLTPNIDGQQGDPIVVPYKGVSCKSVTN